MHYTQIPDFISQSKQIETHLMAGNSLSGIEALHLFRCRDLPKRISELRKSGYRIQGTWNTDAKGSRYMRYQLDTRPELRKSWEVQDGDRVVIESLHPLDAYFDKRAEIVGLRGTIKDVHALSSEHRSEFPGLRYYRTCSFAADDGEYYYFFAAMISRI